MMLSQFASAKPTEDTLHPHWNPAPTVTYGNCARDRILSCREDKTGKKARVRGIGTVGLPLSSPLSARPWELHFFIHSPETCQYHAASRYLSSIHRARELLFMVLGFETVLLGCSDHVFAMKLQKQYGNCGNRARRFIHPAHPA